MTTRKANRRDTRRPEMALGALFLLSACLAAPATGDDKPVPPGFEKGKFQELTGPISRLLKLTRTGKSLRLDRKYWEKDFQDMTRAEAVRKLEDELVDRGMSRNWAAQRARQLLGSRPVELIFNRLQAAAGGLGSSSSAGGSLFTKSFSGNGLTARMKIAGKSFHITLEEEALPHRRLELSEDEGGALRIILSDKAGRFVLAVIQGTDGRFSVAHIAGDETSTDVAGSFQDFCARRRPYVHGTLLPLLRHMGIGLPPTRYDAKVKRAVLAGLRGPPTGKEARRAAQLVKELNDESPEKREQASKVLSADFARHRELIREAIGKASNPPEVASRLATIVAENADQDEIDKFLTDQKLTEDVGYLIEMLGEATSADRPVIAGALDKLTGQKLGADPAAWQKWWSAKTKVE